MDDITTIKDRSAEEEIVALARAHGVSYQPTMYDDLADNIT